MPNDVATVFIVPPRRIATGGSGSSPYARTIAVSVWCKVPSPPEMPRISMRSLWKSSQARCRSSRDLVASAVPCAPMRYDSRWMREGSRRLSRERGLVMSRSPARADYRTNAGGRPSRTAAGRVPDKTVRTKGRKWGDPLGSKDLNEALDWG